MSRRLVVAFFLVVTSIITTQANAAAPTLLSAVSRMSHGNAGTHDVQLPLSGGTGVECRGLTSGTQIILTFDQPVHAGSAAMTAGTATVGTPTFSNYTMTVPLSGMVNADTLTLSVSNVLNGANESLDSASVSFRTLFGDVTGDGVLNVVDITAVRGASATGSVTNGTFRCDLTNDGVVNVTDVTAVRSAVAGGATVAGGPTNNTPPTISQLANQTVVTGTAMLPAGFTVADNESDPSLLAVTAASSDQLTIPNSAITVSGTGASRTLTLTPAVGVTAVTPVTITMYLSDGLAYSTAMTFTVNVTPPPTSYLATLSPISGTSSLGSGTALLTVSGDQTYAIIKYGYSNLSTTQPSDDAIYDSTGAVLYDMPVGRARGDLQPDGSLKWTFSASKQSSIIASISSNASSILVETATDPSGEIKGTFKLISGSQTFTPPPPPPSITINPPTPADASRFLQQAGFGGTGAEIAALSNTGAANASTAINDWLTNQYNQPLPISPNYAACAIAPTTQATVKQTPQSTTQPYSTSSMYAQIYNRVSTTQNSNGTGDALNSDRVPEVWWKNGITGPDPLRQRVATALSELFVVSENDGTISDNIPGLASYYDMLADDAFGNFRQLLGDVTLHPIMGHYLNMLGNGKAVPNENYAREIMQLFSIGLYMLNPDGTLQLDASGAPIPTYTQPLVTSFAAVYTGWTYPTTRPTIPQLEIVSPATQPSIVNFTSYYQLPMTVTASNHSTAAKTLLNYSGASKYGSATQPAYIPATSSQSVATATAELNFALDNIFNHPNVGPFIAKQLIQRLVESNPSPAYVYRVAQVFNNDGSGVRGNMRAVITAILTDYEARSTTVQTAAGFGHMREPMLRMADLMHSLNAVSKSGKWQVGRTDSTLSQTLFRSPTVFNFFDPGYAEPGAVQQDGLVSPEFDIIFETTITNAQNMIYTGVYSSYYTDTATNAGAPKLTGTGWRGDNYGSDVYLDLSAAGANLVALDQADQTAKTTSMLSQVVKLLNGGPLDSSGDAQSRIQKFLNTITGSTLTNSVSRVEAAIHLVATSSQVAAEK